MTQNYEQLRGLSPFRIALIYFLVAGLWVFFSDEALERAVSNPALLTQLQTYKGLFYILLTTVGLYWLIKRQNSERKEFESEHSLDQELMTKLFERIPAMITVYSPGLDHFVVNREFEEVVGWSTEEANNIDLMKACFPDPDYRKKVADFMSRPDTGWAELTVTSREDDKIHSSWTNIRLSDETQVGIGIDLTELKKSEAELLESQRLLRNTFESLEESLIVVGPGKRMIVDCNKATENLFGYSREELIGESTRKLHVNEDMFNEFDHMGTRQLAETGTFKTEFRMKKKSGEVFDSDHTVSLVYDEAGEVERVVSVIRDISGKKRAEERELKSVIEAEERERRRIARELHDGIGQYLSASHMNMEAVKREAGHLSEKSRSRFETGLSLLKKAIGETRNTAHNLMPHVLEDYGLELALHTLVEKTGEGREIELVLESEIDDTVLDKVTSFNLYRIIQEAINNAIKHGKCSKISIKVCQGDDLLACTISDNGIGAEIDEAQAGGIGIRNMKSRVQSMSGTFDFRSRAGEGMTIEIRIPLSDQDKSNNP